MMTGRAAAVGVPNGLYAFALLRLLPVDQKAHARAGQQAEYGQGPWEQGKVREDGQMANGPDLAYYLCFGPAGPPDEHLMRIAGTRWAIEDCFQTTKTEVGLNHH